MSWYAVVLSWNGKEDTINCLSALRETEGEPRLICVDNGSVDGSPEAVRERFPDVELIENGANLGFAGGCNAGIRRALADGADWVVLVNNDAEVAPDAFSAFAAAAQEHPRAGVLGGKLYFADRRDVIWFAGQRFWPALGYSGRARGEGKRDGPRYSEIVSTDRAVGALMAISRPALEAVGLFNEALFAYAEDVDLCLRVRDAGFEVLIVPGANAWHKVAGSSGGETSTTNLYYGTRNNIVVCEHRRPLPVVLRSLRRLVVLAGFAAHALLTRPRKGSALRAVWAGFRDARAGRLGQRPEAAG